MKKDNFSLSVLLHLSLVLFISLFTACAPLTPVTPDDPQKVYRPAGKDLFARFAPHFVLQTYDKDYNRIGRASAGLSENGDEKIYINPEHAVMYAQQQPFTTINGSYTNLIYRIHFDSIPFNFIPFHVSSGKNIGLFVIVTLSSDNLPVLITTVHTCGCYRAIIPTSHLAKDAYPPDWDVSIQELWGEKLTGLLNFEGIEGENPKLIIVMRDETHRVMDVAIKTEREVKALFEPLPIAIEPMGDLKALPLANGTTTSFYETDGWRKGYVKGSNKPWELLLVSWWAFDLNVGVDKELGDRNETGNVFYTSLRPWYRSESDMWQFADFLSFWGWGL